jgi:hypothetical protein
MFAVILAVLIGAGPEPRIVQVLEGREFALRGITADLIERPAGITDEQFAQDLIDAEGLVPWNGEQFNSAPTEERMGTRAVFSADGREIIVKYVSGDSQRPGIICRLRLTRGGMSDARWNAYRWCASALGRRLPDAPTPPITTVRRQR